ncbi:hypothetical protein M8Z33_33560 [Streptomyces sp. ZAF1911]|uniref:hypothetical protein n=1 Tax=Streptomyces sp. ZAF1911 TaxID=2944129 RepID=UPI00237B5B06|nr:hypothetical protein [Streptomyces sp. ZAF1911]MDD9381492.1 hypothetical protein [Streptomyces sp. ZAF1911]
MSYRPRLRSAVIGACTAALLAGSGLLALPAQAASPQATAASVLRSTSSERTIDAFVQEYIYAVGASHSEGLSPEQVREKYLSKELDEALTTWGSDQQKNPIFRREESPKAFDRVETGQADGGAKVVTTYTWEDGTKSDVWFTVGVDSQIITGLTDPS